MRFRPVISLALPVICVALVCGACRGNEKTPRTHVRDVDQPSENPENDQPAERDAEAKREAQADE